MGRLELNSNAEDLKQILTDELELYQNLLITANRKKKFLLERFSIEFKKIVSEEEALIQQLLNLEDKRLECLKLIIGSEAQISLDNAIEAISEANLKSDLWLVGTKLKDVANEVKAVNAENQRLLEQALEITRHTINLITRVPSDGTYGPSGKERPQNRVSVGIIDRKA